VVTSFEVAREAGHAGGADIGFATSTDAGATWTSGFLSGLTTVQGGTAAANRAEARSTGAVKSAAWRLRERAVFGTVGTQPSMPGTVAQEESTCLAADS
jgi:hypothetical protein